MFFAAITLVLVAFLFNVVTSSETALRSPWQTANFQFTLAPAGISVTVPTTAQCDTVNITWVPLNNGSPDPVPPYHLKVYTSTMKFPIIVDAGMFSPLAWTVPFAPDTQYQVCMFDSKGQTGGCQEKYTVTAPRNTTRTCNATFTTPKTLNVDGVTETGPLTQYGWPDQCTTLKLMPSNGTAPYNMTIAPSLHPPLNLTFNTNDPIEWTITLAWGMQFWISIVDSEGASWAFGPLHSGGNGATDCLHLGGNSLVKQPPDPGRSSDVSPGAAVGIALGSLIFGILVTLATQWLLGYARRPNGKKSGSDSEETRAISAASVSTPGIDPYHVGSVRSRPLSDTPDGDAAQNPIPSGDRNESQVYVVHHDAGGAPITIFTGGRDVQELPPHYSRSTSEPRTTHLTHTPSTSMDSTANTSSTARRAKISPPPRTVTN